MKINFGEIKKWLWAAGGMIGLILTSVLDLGFLPDQWKPVVQGVIALLALTGVYQVSGPTGLPVIQHSNGRHATE